MAVQIIAEVGECFNGSMERAQKMIKEAAQAGCCLLYTSDAADEQ